MNAFDVIMNTLEQTQLGIDALISHRPDEMMIPYRDGWIDLRLLEREVNQTIDAINGEISFDDILETRGH